MSAWEGIAAQLAAEHRQHVAETARIREVVLADPELCARLTAEPLGYARPDQWNGYVPPQTWNGAHNDSARREALMEIIADAIARTAT